VKKDGEKQRRIFVRFRKKKLEKMLGGENIARPRKNDMCFFRHNGFGMFWWLDFLSNSIDVS
jgi:hypothetical protein